MLVNACSQVTAHTEVKETCRSLSFRCMGPGDGTGLKTKLFHLLGHLASPNYVVLFISHTDEFDVSIWLGFLNIRFPFSNLHVRLFLDKD